MRKSWFALSALAALAISASVASRTEAAPLGPTALFSAIDELAVTGNVHCRPGRPHHEPNRYRRADGCIRSAYRRGVVVTPGRDRYIYRDGVRVLVR